uniref:Uncharacterized protein n=1 Tax=Chlamydomonas leiostraca TaxID=1034604 RepID=A0A7S0S4I6_9CHLO|mmetsp:Transcript_7832/g.19518  ORF Transcript_7832/g.19518 Transcript_7832/m.19518 type:complete len:315 (+) Transcript_7832:284-1228(+)
MQCALSFPPAPPSGGWPRCSWRVLGVEHLLATQLEHLRGDSPAGFPQVQVGTLAIDAAGYELTECDVAAAVSSQVAACVQAFSGPQPPAAWQCAAPVLFFRCPPCSEEQAAAAAAALQSLAPLLGPAAAAGGASASLLLDLEGPLSGPLLAAAAIIIMRGRGSRLGSLAVRARGVLLSAWEPLRAAPPSLGCVALVADMSPPALALPISRAQHRLQLGLPEHLASEAQELLSALRVRHCVELRALKPPSHDPHPAYHTHSQLDAHRLAAAAALVVEQMQGPGMGWLDAEQQAEAGPQPTIVIGEAPEAQQGGWA